MMQPPSAHAFRAVEIPGIPACLWPLLLRAAGSDRLAVVGGAVRDLLLHSVHRDPWRGVTDLDLVVDGSETTPEGAEHPNPRAALRLAQALEKQLAPGQLVAVQEHGAYGTVELELLLAEGPLLLDLASARLESYPVVGENPVVRAGRLEDDLARRDFSINAMALVLSFAADAAAQDGPSLILFDPHGGQADLSRRELRFLHGGSVRDDPTRLIRAARYAARLGFRLAAEGRLQAQDTLAAWPWSWRHGQDPALAPAALGTRLRGELDLLLKREPWPIALAALQQWGGLALLDDGLQADRHWLRRLRWASRLGLPALVALLAGCSAPLAVAERLQLPHRQHQLLAQWLRLAERLAQVSGSGSGEACSTWSPSGWAALLEGQGVTPAAVALALAAGTGPRRPLLRWWLRWRHLRGDLVAADLLVAGVAPGPALGERLRRSRAARLDRERL
jgi:poly(A) polymerase